MDSELLRPSVFPFQQQFPKLGKIGQAQLLRPFTWFYAHAGNVIGGQQGVQGIAQGLATLRKGGGDDAV